MNRVSYRLTRLLFLAVFLVSCGTKRDLEEIAPTAVTQTTTFQVQAPTDATEDLAPAPLPEPWQRSDVGTLPAPGTSSFADDTFNLGAEAPGLAEQTDALHYVYQPLTRDGSLTMRISGLADDAKAGISVRSALAADAPHTSLWVQGAQGVPSIVSRDPGPPIATAGVFGDVRTVSDAALEQTDAQAVSSTQASAALPAASRWLRLTRRGNAVGTFTSDNDQNWQQVGYETFKVTNSTTIGFWVAGKTGDLSASVDNVSFGAPVGELRNPGEPIEILLNPWNGTTINSGTGETGVRNDNALYSLSARGGTDAAPVTEFMYRQERSGDALYVSVSELRALQEDGAVGLMIRGGLATNSPYAFVKFTPEGIALETNINGQRSQTLLEPARETLPLWLQIASVDNTVTVYQTQDVINWDAIGSAQVPLGDDRYLGIAVRSSGGEVTGAFTRPRLIHAGDHTLLGIDGNGNGVRDDVEQYLSVTYSNTEQAQIRDALTQVARTGMAVLTTGNADTLDAYDNARSVARELLGAANEYQLGLLESEVFDSPLRLDYLLTLIERVAKSAFEEMVTKADDDVP